MPQAGLILGARREDLGQRAQVVYFMPAAQVGYGNVECIVPALIFSPKSNGNCPGKCRIEGSQSWPWSQIDHHIELDPSDSGNGCPNSFEVAAMRLHIHRQQGHDPGVGRAVEQVEGGEGKGLAKVQ